MNPKNRPDNRQVSVLVVPNNCPTMGEKTHPLRSKLVRHFRTPQYGRKVGGGGVPFSAEFFCSVSACGKEIVHHTMIMAVVVIIVVPLKSAHVFS